MPVETVLNAKIYSDRIGTKLWRCNGVEGEEYTIIVINGDWTGTDSVRLIHQKVIPYGFTKFKFLITYDTWAQTPSTSWVGVSVDTSYDWSDTSRVDSEIMSETADWVDDTLTHHQHNRTTDSNVIISETSQLRLERTNQSGKELYRWLIPSTIRVNFSRTNTTGDFWVIVKSASISFIK